MNISTPQASLARRVKLSAAASNSGMSTKTLRRRIADGSLPGYRLGSRLILVDLDDVEALFERIPTMEKAS